MAKTPQLPIGIALGSGSARGWAHIGVLRALEEIGIVPEIVCGTSIGSLVGAAYASNRLDTLEEWVLDLRRWNVLRLMDFSISGLEGERLMKAFCERVENAPIESLSKKFGTVATDISTGREVWFTRGSIREAVRASIALPGLFSPVRQDQRWLVDGGLVDPVPVSLCRALGAERVIAVNLNGDIVGRHFLRRSRLPNAAGMWEYLGTRLQTLLGTGRSEEKTSNVRPQGEGNDDMPNVFDVMFGAMNVMQDRITRSRLAGDPPDVVLSPRLAHLALIDFNRAEEAIARGRECVALYQSVLRDLLNLTELKEESMG